MQTFSATAGRRPGYLVLYSSFDVVAPDREFTLVASKRARSPVALTSTSALADDRVALARRWVDKRGLRPGFRLDLVGWQRVHRRHPTDDADWLLQCDDSVYGPLADIAGVLDPLMRGPAHLYGAASSPEHGWYAQSWLLLRPSAFRSAAFRRRMDDAGQVGLGTVALIGRSGFELPMAMRADRLPVATARDPHRNGPIAAVVPVGASRVVLKKPVRGGRTPFVEIKARRDNPIDTRGTQDWRDVIGPLAPAPMPAVEQSLAQCGTRRPVTFAQRRRRRLGTLLPLSRAVVRRDYKATTMRRRRPARLKLTAVSFRNAPRIDRESKRLGHARR